MIKAYIMSTCPDCIQVKEQAKYNPQLQLVDIGEHVHNLKEFLRLRDTNPVFDSIKANGSVGIPCFVLEDGQITFDFSDVNLEKSAEGPACSLDGKGC